MKQDRFCVVHLFIAEVLLAVKRTQLLSCHDALLELVIQTVAGQSIGGGLQGSDIGLLIVTLNWAPPSGGLRHCVCFVTGRSDATTWTFGMKGRHGETGETGEVGRRPKCQAGALEPDSRTQTGRSGGKRSGLGLGPPNLNKLILV